VLRIYRLPVYNILVARVIYRTYKTTDPLKVGIIICLWLMMDVEENGPSGKKNDAHIANCDVALDNSCAVGAGKCANIYTVCGAENEEKTFLPYGLYIIFIYTYTKSELKQYTNSEMYLHIIKTYAATACKLFSIIYICAFKRNYIHIYVCVNRSSSCYKTIVCISTCIHYKVVR